MNSIDGKEVSLLISNKNKFELWNLFNSKNYFNNVDSKQFQKVQDLFEESINSVYKKYINNNNNFNMQNANNEIEHVFKQNMSVFMEEQKAKNVEDYRINELSKLMENKKNELENIINPKKPENIDFSIKENDEPFKENLDEIIKKTMEERQNQITEIISKFEPSSSSQTQALNNENINDNDNNNQINISDLNTSSQLNNTILSNNINKDFTNIIDLEQKQSNLEINSLKEKIGELTELNKKIIESQIILIDLIENNNESVTSIKKNIDKMKKLYLTKENISIDNDNNINSINKKAIKKVINNVNSSIKK